MKALNLIFLLYCLSFLNSFLCEESSVTGGKKCVNYEGQPNMCYPPFQNHASAGLKIMSTNTCGLFRRQKYCIGLSSAEMKFRCAYCDESNIKERHSADYLTEHNVNNWWQSETLADNKIIHYKQSINLTLNLGKQFHVTFIHLQFKSPRPRAMVIYRKYDDHYPWTPWLYLASNCKTYFNMSNSKGQIIKKYNDVLCTQEFSSLSDFYNGIVMFAPIFGRPGAEDFFNNKKIMDWATASQIRIELKKMQTFGDQNAEEEILLTQFYAIKSIQVAARCWCNGHGNECRRSTGEGIEPKLFCVCHPSHHTSGQSCEKCDNFYQDRPWQMATATNPHDCKRCNCNDNSNSCIFNEDLYIKSGNITGGFCLNCFGNTKGPHCEDCIEGFYKDLNRPNRCIPCNCDPKGRASIQCDQLGKCVCQPGVEGDKCTRCKVDHYNFGSSGCQRCNCNLNGINKTDGLHCNPESGICYCKKNVIGEKCDRCVQGYFSLTAEDPLGCRPCFCFAHTKECTNANGFVLMPIISEFKFDEDGWKYGIGINEPIFTPMLDISTKPHALTWFQSRDPWINDYFLWAPVKFVGNQRLSYNLFLELTLSFSSRPSQNIYTHMMSMLNDVELISDTMSVNVPFNVEDKTDLEFEKEARVYRFRLNEESGLWRARMDHFRFISILNNLTAIKVRLTNPLGFTKLHKAVLYTAVEERLINGMATSFPRTTNIEKCSCPPQYTGFSCESCAMGYHRLSSVGTEFVKCIKCMCNNQSEVCDVRTGKCDCKYNTSGHNCEICEVGYYGDPTTSIRDVCKPCECPGGTACELVKTIDKDMVVCTDCPDNLGGYRCTVCRDNYFGNPKLNISCKPCDCHGNIDYLSSCDSLTGKCSNCLYNSFGDYCESCIRGYYLSENQYAPNRCKKCLCNPLGSIEGGINCNVKTGQCHCHPLVIGQSCEKCLPGYFNLTRNVACEPCNCLILGSLNHTCDLTSGQCFCKPGVVGINCDKCDFGNFNLSQSGCQRCECDSTGSQSLNCNITTGECLCKSNVKGSKCDRCIENHHNVSGGCPNCPPCYGLILKKITGIKADIQSMLQNVNSRNESDERFNNLTNLINFSQKLNTTIFELMNVIMKDYSKISSVNEEILQSRNSLKNISKNMFDFFKSNKNMKLQMYIEDIKSLKEKIEGLIKIAFEDNVEKLKSYIKENSATNTDITNMAEQTKTSLTEVNFFKQKIMLKVLKAEKDLNASLVNFVELVTSYYTFINESEQFDIALLRKLSSNVSESGLTNLKEINKIDQRQDNIGRLFNETSQKLNKINSNMEQLFKELSDITENARVLEENLKMFMTTIPNFEDIERSISSKLSITNEITQNMALLKDLKRRLDDAERNITNALSQAQNNLQKLEDIKKDFDEFVKASKENASLHLNKLPQLKQQLGSIQQEIKSIRSSSLEIINKMEMAYNNSQLVHLQSNELDLEYKILLSKTLDLNKKSIQDSNLSVNIKSVAHNKSQANSKVLIELQNIVNTLEKTSEINDKQKKSADDFGLQMMEIERKLKLVEEHANTASNENVEEYLKLLKTITSNLETFEQNQIKSLKTEMELMEEEWILLNKEIEETDLEIKRLESIKDYMIGSTFCHKSGGNVER